MADESDAKWNTVHKVILDRVYDMETFSNAVEIWLERPQVLNRRLVGSCILQSFQTTEHEEVLSSVFTMSEEDGPISREKLLQLQSDYESRVEHDSDIQENMLDVRIRTLLPRQSNKYKNVSEVIIQDRRGKSVMFIPFEEDESTNQMFSKIEHAYQVSLHKYSVNHQSMNLSVLAQRTTGDGFTCPTVEWLKSRLLPKLHKWMQEDSVSVKSLGSSLRLVPVDRYTQKYEELKKKYKHFVKMWPERTDPYKFVYEDVAIATYLLLLWQDDQDDKAKTGKVQTFVDLGCGNGLLVHILTNEGHLGKGIDLRPRKVWKFYENKTDLQVSSLDPSSLTYPDVDWLIGNHSDELTPWIPVIAAKSSYNCKYFVLPCCFHDFYCKFQRECANESQYRSYLNYVQDIGQTCGFQVKEDILRIPSTKKVCQIGQVRTYFPTNQNTIEENITTMLHNTRYHTVREHGGSCDVETRHPTDSEIPHEDISSCQHETVKDPQSFVLQSEMNLSQKQDFVEQDKITTLPQKARCTIVRKQGRVDNVENQHAPDSRVSCEDRVPSRQHITVATSHSVSKTFVPRPDKEPVKNCTQLDKKLLEDIVQKVATELLSRSDEEKADKAWSRDGAKTWNKGGCMKLSEVSTLFDQEVLNELRSEAGGIKTVLRNSHQIFKVHGGIVEIRDWREESHAVVECSKKDVRKRQNGTKKYWKTKRCWFDINHPDGCPLLANQCSFAHGTDDVKTINH